MKLIGFFLAAGAAFAQTTSYPGALDSDGTLFVVADNVQTTLNVAMAPTDNVAILKSGTGFAVNMIATICDVTAAVTTNVSKCSAWEHMLITAVNGQSVTLTRGLAGTTARSHAVGAIISILIDSVHQTMLKQATIAIETALGANLQGTNPGPNWPTFSSEWADFSRNVNSYPSTSFFANNGMAIPYAIRGAINIPANAQGLSHGAGVAGYAITASSNNFSVGLFGMALANATNFAGVTGVNTVTSNCVAQICANGGGFQSSANVAGAEFDLNLMKVGTAAYNGNGYGLEIAGGVEAQPAGNLDAIHIFPAGGFSGATWKKGFSTEDGAADVGVSVGAKASGNNVPSQPIEMRARTSGGLNVIVGLFADSSGGLNLFPAPGAQITLMDGGLNGALSIAPNGSTPFVAIGNQLQLGHSAFASRPNAVSAGVLWYCTDCTAAATCVGGGSGHLAVSTGPGTTYACQ